MQWRLLLVSVLFSSLFPPLSVGAQEAPTGPMAKITFDLDQLDENGLMGPPDGQRAMHYEFCVPQDNAMVREVQQLDPTVILMAGSRGRIGCTADQVLAVGSTHQHHYRDVLLSLASLDYIEQIDPFWGE